MKKIIIILMFCAGNLYAQDFHKIDYEFENTQENIKITKQEMYLVLYENEVNKSLLDKCEVFCDNLQSSISDKYIDHNYTFYRKTNLLSETTTNSFEDIVMNHKNDIVVILKYQKNLDGSIKKVFLLIENGEALRCYIDGAEQPRLR